MSPVAGAAVAAAGAASLFATYWDDAWHTDLGRDTATIPPHLLLYGSVAVAGAVVAGWGLRALVRTGSATAVLRHPPLLLAGLGGTATLAAAPIDAAWHAAFGRDSVLWSPPHMLVVLASATMVAGVLTGVRATRHGVVETALAALLLGSLAASVIEYETDVPQFAEHLYLPVLLAAGLLATGCARALGRHRAPVTAMVLGYAAFRLACTGLLPLLGRSAPELPIAVLGLALADLPARTATVRLAAAAAGTSALAWLAAATGAAGEPPAAVATVAVPVIVAAAAIAAASHLRGHRLAAVVVAVPVAGLAAVAAIVAGAPPAAAHDPGQGRSVATAQLSGRSDGAGRLELDVTVPVGPSREPGCRGTTPIRLVARRAGDTVAAPLRDVGDCRYGGSVRVPGGGRWFVYAELRHGGQGAETWLPIDAGEAGALRGSRDLYVPAVARPQARTVQVVAGIAIYATALALLGAAVRRVLVAGPGLRPQPGP
jgi:hypothetical protein